MKPSEYRECYVLTKDTPYSVEENQHKGTHSSTGLLKIGRVVWIKERLEERASDQCTLAYAEGVGLVTLDPSSLRPAQ